MEKKKIEKGSVQETLLLPLYGRKRAMEMYPGNFNDLDCQRIYNEVEIDYNRYHGENRCYHGCHQTI